MGMDTKEMQERLAAHVESDAEPAAEPESKVEDDAVVSDPIDESSATNVGQVIRLFNGKDTAIVVNLLRKIGALVERGDKLVYTLYKPLAKPLAGGVDQHRGVKVLEFTTEPCTYHKRRMAEHGEGGINAVLLTWVEVLTGEPRGLIDRLSIIDGEAAMNIAHFIEGQSKNG